MRRLIRIALAVTAALIVVLAVLPFLVPMDAYREPLAAAASRATGREVGIAGDLRLSIYPEFGLSAGDVTVSNVPGARDPQMVTVGSLTVGVRLLPLLSGNVEIARLVLDEPVVRLEVSADGMPNWTSQEAAAAETQDRGATPLRLSSLRISNGEVTYFDRRSGKSTAIDDVDASLDMASAEGPMTFDGALTFNEERLEFDGNVERPYVLLEGGDSAVDVELESGIVTASIAGTFAAGGRSAGKVTLGLSSLRRLAEWTGNSMPPGDNLGAATLDADFAAEDRRVALSQLRMTLDGMTITGELELDSRNPTIGLGGGLAVDRLDLNRYLAAATPGAPESAGPSATPLQFDLLKSVNADLTLSIGQLQAQNLTFERAALGAGLRDGLLNAELRELSIYGGTGRGTLLIDARGAIPQFRHALRVTGLDAQPFLTALMGIDRIRGRGTLELEGSSQGSSEREIMQALAGSATVSFTDGAIRGVDLAGIARTIQSLVNSQGLGNLTGAESATEFTEMGGAFAMRDGIARNEDFRLVSPVLRIDGTGEVDFVRRSLDFHLRPRPVAAGTVGGVELSRIGVPFRVSGPWSNLSYVPDIGGLATGVLQGIIGDGQGAPQVPLGDPVDALQSLFGLGGRGQ